MSDNIKVAIRVRPLITREKDHASDIYWTVDENFIRQKDSNSKPFFFDRVFDQPTTTDDVYHEIAKPIVSGAMEGFNGTIFAYGQTASGKTFTMMGSQQNAGIISLAIQDIFNTIENTVDREFLIRVAYLEIYNESVCDLLGDSRKHLDVREGQGGIVYVENLKEELVNSEEQILAHMKRGESSRHFGHTKMNERSSRSHTIFQITIESRERTDDPRKSVDGAVKVSHLNLVDLAGSEKAKHTGATGQRLTEGGFINKSLFSLGQVISQLSEGTNFVNYRDSRLTRILQNALGGNSRTAIICNVTPASQEETISTLRFATSAKRIQNKPVLNEVMSDEALMRRYKSEMQNLQKELDQIKAGDVNLMREENVELQQRLAEKELLQKQQEDKISKLKEFICVSSRPQNSDFNTKKKRRETWCPGKARMSMAPGNFVGRSLDLAVRTRFPSADIREVEDDLFGKVTRRLASESSIAPPLFSVEETEEDISLPIGSAESTRSSRRVCFDPILENIDLMMADVECQTEPWTPGAEMDPERTDDIDRLQSEVAEKTRLVEELQQQQQQPPATESEKDQQISELREELANQQAEVSSLSETLEHHRQLHEHKERELQAEVDMLKECVREAAEHTSDASDWPEKYAELEQKYQKLQADSQETFVFSKGLIEDLQKTQEAQETIEKQMERLQLTNDRLSAELISKDYELKELEEFTRNERDFKDESIMERHEMAEKLTELQSHNTDWDMHAELERSKFQRRETELREQLEVVYQENSELRRQTTELVSGSVSEETDPGNSSAEMEQLRCELAKLQQENSALKESSEALEAEVKSLKQQLEDASLSSPHVDNPEATSLRQSLAELEEENSQLKIQLEIYAALPSPTAEVDQLLAEIETLKNTQLNTSNCQDDASASEVKNLKQEISVLRAQNAELLAGHDALSKEGSESGVLLGPGSRAGDGSVLEDHQVLRKQLADLQADNDHLTAKLKEVCTQQVSQGQQPEGGQSFIENPDVTVGERSLAMEMDLTMPVSNLASELEAAAKQDSLASELQAASNTESLASELQAAANTESLASELQAAANMNSLSPGLGSVTPQTSEMDSARPASPVDQSSEPGSSTEADLIRTIQKLKQELQMSWDEKTTLEEDLRESVQGAIDAQDELREVQGRVAELESQVAILTEQLADASPEKTGTLTDTNMSEDTAVVESLRNSLEQANHDLEDAYIKVTELEAELEEKQEALQKQIHSDGSPESDPSLEEQIRELTEQLLQMEIDHAAATEKVSESEAQLAELNVELASYREQVSELTTQADAQQGLNQELTSYREQVEELETQMAQYLEMEKDLTSCREQVDELSTQVAMYQEISTLNEKSGVGDVNAQVELKQARKDYRELLEKYEKLEGITNTTKGQLLSEENRDLDLQKRLEALEKVHKDLTDTFGRTMKENQDTISSLEKQVYELMCQLQKAKSEAELAIHKQGKLEDEKGVLKEELRSLENLLAQHESTRGRQQNMDPERMLDRIKKLSVSLDLTNQRCQNYQDKVKELEGVAQKMDDAVFHRNNLQREVRELQHSLKLKTDEICSIQERNSGSHMMLAELRLEADSLRTQLKRKNLQEGAEKEQHSQVRIQLEEVERRSKEDVARVQKQAQEEMASMELKAKQEVSRLQQEAQDELAHVQQQLEAARKNLVDAEERIAAAAQEYAAKLEELQQELTMYKNAAEANTKKLEHSDRLVAELETKLNKESLALKEAEHKLQDAESRALSVASDITEEVQQLQKQLVESKALSEEKDEKLEHYSQLVQELETKLTEAQEQLKQAEKDMLEAENRAASTLSGSAAEMEALCKERDAYKDAAQANEESVALATKQLEDLEAQLKDIQVTAAGNQVERDQLLCDMEQELRSTQERLVEAEKAAQDAEASAATTLSDSAAELQQLSEQLQDQQNAACMNQEQVEQYRQLVEEMETKLKGADEQLLLSEQKLQEAVTNGADELQKLQQEWDIYKVESCEQLASHKQMLEDLELRLREAESEQERVETLAADEAEAHQRELKRLDQERDSCRQGNEDELQQYSIVVKELENKLQAVQEKLLLAEKSLELANVDSSEKDKIEQERDSFKNDYEAAKEEMEYYKSVIDEMETELCDLRVKLQKAEQQASEVKPSVDTSQIESLQNELDSVKSSYEDAKEEMEYYKGVIDELEGESADLKIKLNAFENKQGSGSQKSSEVKALQKQYDTLQLQFTQLQQKYKKAQDVYKQSTAQLQAEVMKLRSYGPSDSSKDALLAERKQLKAELADYRLKINALETEIMRDNVPLKERIKSLIEYNEKLQEANVLLKSDLRRLKNNQQDASMMCSKCAEEGPASGAVTQNLNQFRLESEKNLLEREVKRLTHELGQKQKEMAKSQENEDALRSQTVVLQERVDKFKRYCRNLNDKDKAVLKEIINSPVPAQGSRRAKPAMAAAKEDEPPECKTQ